MAGRAPSMKSKVYLGPSLRRNDAMYLNAPPPQGLADEVL